MIRLKLTHPRSKIAIGIFCLIMLISITGCRCYEAVGKDGEYFRAFAFASDTQFDGLVAVSDPNSGMNIIIIDNFDADAETGEAGVLIGNVLKTLLRP